jgi:hypothetical protein
MFLRKKEGKKKDIKENNEERKQRGKRHAVN